jgi:hypothetical protein
VGPARMLRIRLRSALSLELWEQELGTGADGMGKATTGMSPRSLTASLDQRDVRGTDPCDSCEFVLCEAEDGPREFQGRWPCRHGMSFPKRLCVLPRAGRSHRSGSGRTTPSPLPGAEPIGVLRLPQRATRKTFCETLFTPEQTLCNVNTSERLFATSPVRRRVWGARYKARMVTVQLDGLEEIVMRAVADAMAAQQPTAPAGFLDVEGAADFIASTPAAIRSLVQRGEIPFHKAPNGRLLFDREELERWVRSG